MGKFIDRVCTYKNRYKLTNNSDGTVTLDRVWGTVTQAGTPLSASALNAACPPGVGRLFPFAGASAPTGWLLCQGQAVSRNDLRRIICGNRNRLWFWRRERNIQPSKFERLHPCRLSYSAQTEFNYRGKTGGEKSHALHQKKLQL